MLRVILVAATAISLSVPAMAQTTAAATSAAGAKQSDADKVVCKREEQIGSRLMSKKVCMTVQQWEERQREDQDSVHRLQQDTAGPKSG